MSLLKWILALKSWSHHGLDASVIPQSQHYLAQPLAITHFFDNSATQNFDGEGSYYPRSLLPRSTLASENVNFSLPDWGAGHMNNVISNGQLISVNGSYTREFHVLYAGDWIDGESTVAYDFNFVDGTTQTVDCSVKNWWNLHWLNSGPIQIPYHETSNGRNHNLTQIHHWSTTVSSKSLLKSIKLPDLSSYNRLHIFAISLVPAVSPPGQATSPGASSAIAKSISVKNARLTSGFIEDGLFKGSKIVEVTLANLQPSNASNWKSSLITGNFTVHVVGAGTETKVPGRIRRLMAGDDARVDVGVQLASSGSSSSTTVRIELRDAQGNAIVRSEEWKLAIVKDQYVASRDSLSRHESPRWWKNSKFGIFIHWGVYSVPGWVPIGYYEEWYHWWIHNPAQPSNILWNYHRNTYGENVVYDDFIGNFTGAKFDANAWVDLFAGAGAKYFVLVTKHHDGFALFDTQNSTHRSSVHLGPHRDFLGELMVAAKERHPELKKGTYYSMPEWFNPAFTKYGFGNWPGGLAKNAYDPTKLEPYTGHLEGKDYLKDIQLAHMRTLAEQYETDIMWCDIGGPNRTAEFAAKWYNDARSQGRQVTMNNRCGIAPDFDTPEYARFSSVQTRSWETNEGIDPYSYGYNQQTRDEDYRSAHDIIHSLVDIVSKNGNYLLNLGPNGEGEIIPAMVERILEVGTWLKHSGSCIYSTTYSFSGAEEASLRFTTTPDTFCIISLERPLTDEADSSTAVLTMARSVPIVQGDEVYLLGGGGQSLRWESGAEGLKIWVPQADLDRVQHAWAFEIRYSV
ncbi:glycoside hydrolase family 29 protein [Serendipita vermifera MAFF 305830]|uniref:alpha-L-fucosidase n=1 Tax=Serendipita vermifera MAFF 305830 TaxID=933852 RepID=A0A0C3AHW2_SERVB|nr:glycoside hydrolase family 29 protein [Serendipita vermifera MAFF 305830]